MSRKPLRSQARNIVYNLYNTIREEGVNQSQSSILKRVVELTEYVKLAEQNLNLDKVCRVNLKYGNTVCDSLIARDSKEFKKEEIAVQEIVSSLEVWKHIIMSAVPWALVLFLGAWSDRTGKRKICILLPMIGRLLLHTSNIFSVYFFDQLSVQVTTLLDAIFNTLTGGYLIMFLGVFCYISDITSQESRTFRIGVAQLCVTVGQASGAALSGILLSKMGYYGVFISSFLLDALNIWYAFVYVHDLKRADKEHGDKGPTSIISGIKSFLDINIIKDVLHFAFKKGQRKSEKNIVLILVCTFFVCAPSEGTILYLFTRYRLDWDVLQFSVYNTCLTVTHILGNFMLVTLGARWLQWHDSVLGLISTGSKIICVAVSSRAKSSLDMYIGAVLGMFSMTTFIALRSIISKICASDEVGKMTSLFTLAEMFASLVMGSLYPWIYKETVAVDAGATLYITAALSAIPVVIFAWLYIQRPKRDGCNKEGVFDEEFIDNNCSSNENGSSIPMLSKEDKEKSIRN